MPSLLPHLTSPPTSSPLPRPPFFVADVGPHASSTSPWSPSLVPRLIIFPSYDLANLTQRPISSHQTPFNYKQLEKELAVTHYKILQLPIHSLRQAFCSIRPVCFDFGTRLARFGTEQFPLTSIETTTTAAASTPSRPQFQYCVELKSFRLGRRNHSVSNSLFGPMRNAIHIKEHRI